MKKIKFVFIILLFALQGQDFAHAQTFNFSGFPANPTQCNPFYSLTSTKTIDWKASHGSATINNARAVLKADGTKTPSVLSDGIFVPVDFKPGQAYAVSVNYSQGADPADLYVYAVNNLNATTNSTCNSEPVPTKWDKEEIFFISKTYLWDGTTGMGFYPNKEYNGLWLFTLQRDNTKGYIFINEVSVTTENSGGGGVGGGGGTLPQTSCRYSTVYINDHFLKYSYISSFCGGNVNQGASMAFGISKNGWTQHVDGTITIRASCSIEINANFECNWGNELTILPVCAGGRMSAQNDNTTYMEAEDIDDFTIFPNPAKSTFSIGSVSGKQNAEITIYNNQGKEIIRTELKGAISTKVDLSENEEGLYLVKINCIKGTISKKVLLLK